MNPLEELNNLTADLVESQAAADKLEAELKSRKKHLRELQHDILPTKMRELGQDMLKLPTGEYLELEDVTTARIPKDNPDAAYEYLEKIGEGGLIKREVICEFRRDQEAEAEEALALLQGEGFLHSYTRKNVHWRTFQSWAETQLKEGKQLPEEILGISTHTHAIVRKKRS